MVWIRKTAMHCPCLFIIIGISFRESHKQSQGGTHLGGVQPEGLPELAGGGGAGGFHPTLRLTAAAGVGALPPLLHKRSTKCKIKQCEEKFVKAKKGKTGMNEKKKIHEDKSRSGEDIPVAISDCMEWKPEESFA
jgi:hypothetical protein